MEPFLPKIGQFGKLCSRNLNFRLKYRNFQKCQLESTFYIHLIHRSTCFIDSTCFHQRHTVTSILKFMIQVFSTVFSMYSIRVDGLPNAIRQALRERRESLSRNSECNDHQTPQLTPNLLQAPQTPTFGFVTQNNSRCSSACEVRATELVYGEKITGEHGMDTFTYIKNVLFLFYFFVFTFSFFTFSFSYFFTFLLFSSYRYF